MKPNKIYVFSRPDGVVWADYKLEGTQISVFSIDTVEKAEHTAKHPGDVLPDRVRALAQRKISEITNEPDVELPPIAPPVITKPKKAWWKFWS